MKNAPMLSSTYHIISKIYQKSEFYAHQSPFKISNYLIEQFFKNLYSSVLQS